MDRLEQVCGLHQRIRIIYVVDGFIATLYHEEGYPYRSIDGKGATIIQALLDLSSKIPEGEPKTWDTRSKGHTTICPICGRMYGHWGLTGTCPNEEDHKYMTKGSHS